MPTLDVKAPTFWRQLAVYVVGGAFVGLPLFVPALAPLIPYLVPAGAGMLGLAGTRFVGGPASAPAPARVGPEEPTPTQRPPAA